MLRHFSLKRTKIFLCKPVHVQQTKRISTAIFTRIPKISWKHALRFFYLNVLSLKQIRMSSFSFMVLLNVSINAEVYQFFFSTWNKAVTCHEIEVLKLSI